MKRKIYLDSTPLDEALNIWDERLNKDGIDAPLTSESLRVTDSLGRITAEAAFARVSSPFYHAAAMDGYAVRFADTFGASETSPAVLKINEQAFYVDTGDPMPDGFNAVIMIEDVNVTGSQRSDIGDSRSKIQAGTKDRGQISSFIEIIEPATPWQHVRTIGEDIVETELILPENHRIRPVDIGALLAGGHTEVKVRRRPRITIIPTGSELVEPGAQLKPGNIIEFNSRVLSGVAAEWGAEPKRRDIVRDDIDELKMAIMSSLDKADMIIINAGSSAGSEDFTSQAIRELGEVLIHGIGIKPGKPVVLGIVSGKPVLGIPGYPVSAYITFNIFAKPLIYKWQGLKPLRAEVIKATLSRQSASSLGQDEFVRVKVGVVKDRTIATPVSRGAGVIMSLVRADGIMRIPSMSEGVGAGAEIDVELMRTRDEIKDTIVCIGSHDNTLDILSNFIRKRHHGLSLASAHTGSMGGLIALKRGDAHIAGTHLLDEETGQYNIPFVKRFLPDKKIVLVNLVYREQGLVVRRGNPGNIKGFEDLVREGITFINRQSGSGTRLLLDKHIRGKGIEPHRIKGYGNEEYTHMGVASAVLTGIADTGLAILAAANALNLDFIPVAKERYDLAIPRDFMGLEIIKALLNIIREDAEFRETVSVLGGYDICDMGKVMFEG